MRHILSVVGVGAALALVIWLARGIKIPEHVVPVLVLSILAVISTMIASRLDKQRGARPAAGRAR